MRVEYDEKKFTELLLHVAERLRRDRAGGATKLNKVLFFADFAHVRRTGAPITGAAYQKLPQGPAPRRLRPVRDALLAKGEAELVREEFLGAPSEYDFVSGPLAAAIFGFREFDNLSYELVPAVRSYTIVDPCFGPVVFVGVLLADGIVEIVDFSDDPDYWATTIQRELPVSHSSSRRCIWLNSTHPGSTGSQNVSRRNVSTAATARESAMP